LTADTLLLNYISLYRSNPNEPFTEVERALKEAIFPHLIMAVRQNWEQSAPHVSGKSTQQFQFNRDLRH